MRVLCQRTFAFNLNGWLPVAAGSSDPSCRAHSATGMARASLSAPSNPLNLGKGSARMNLREIVLRSVMLVAAACGRVVDPDELDVSNAELVTHRAQAL